MAWDKSGNSASCSFKISVKGKQPIASAMSVKKIVKLLFVWSLTYSISVIRCPKIPNVSDGYYICHPSDDMIYGAVCRFGCYAGHELTGGTSEITCTQSGKWSNTFPLCQSNYFLSLQSVSLTFYCSTIAISGIWFCRSNMYTSPTFDNTPKIPMFRWK